MNVLLVEDEEAIRGFVRINLKRNGMNVTEAADGDEALRLIAEGALPDIAILDIMLPTISGLELCRELRAAYPRLGIIMLTAKAQETDKVSALELGADDYVTKPFSPVELIARLKALHRRMQPEQKASANIQSGPFTLLREERKLLKDGREIDLTPTEFAIMELFIGKANKSISRDEILDQVWGRNYIGDLKIVDVNIRRIRQKIEEDPSRPAYIETVWGHGYLWKKEPVYEQH